MLTCLTRGDLRAVDHDCYRASDQQRNIVVDAILDDKVLALADINQRASGSKLFGNLLVTARKFLPPQGGY